MPRSPRTTSFVLASLLIAPLARGGAQRLVTPVPSGPHGVGRHALEWVDSSRKDPADSTRPRVIPGWVWFPATPGATAAASSNPVLDSAWSALRAQALVTKIGSAAADAVQRIEAHARLNATWDDSIRSAPVLLFLPGNGWLPTDYSTIVEDLASHGYVVIGVAPPGFPDVVRLADGHVVPKTLGNGAAIGTDQVEAHQDALLVLRRLAEMNAQAGAPWRGRLDLTRVGAFGHSLGGTTAIVAGAQDTLVRAAVNLDGDAMGDALNARPRQPVLLVSSDNPEMSEAPAGRDSLWYARMAEGLSRSEARRTGEWAAMSSASSWSRRIRIHGTHHLNFTDAALASGLIHGPELRWMRWGPIDGARGLGIAADLTRAFFDQALRGSSGGAMLCDAACAVPELERIR